MQRIITALAISTILSTGCAHGKRAATKAVQVSDVMADQVADGWAAYVDAMIAKCSADPEAAATVETRRACMGKAGEGEKLEAAVAVLVAAQQAVQTVMDGGDGDLISLLAKLTAAYDGLRPYFDAMKGAK